MGLRASGSLPCGVCPTGYEEDRALDAKVWEGLHISEVFERADEFDLIHNHFDFLPLTYSRLTTTPLVVTIHGFSSDRIREDLLGGADTVMCTGTALIAELVDLCLERPRSVL